MQVSTTQLYHWRTQVWDTVGSHAAGYTGGRGECENVLCEKSNYSHASAADNSGKVDELGEKTKKPQNK